MECAGFAAGDDGVERYSLTSEFTVLARDDGSIVANVDQSNPNNQFVHRTGQGIKPIFGSITATPADK